jgi:thiol-disulfide isomerase/thioredoxin
MKLFYFTLVFCFGYFFSAAQSAEVLLSRIQKAQQELQAVSYTLQRIDTFTSGDIWRNTGRCQLDLREPDSALGFRFWAKRDDYNGETLYDGKVAYAIEHKNKTYDAITQPANVYHVLGSPGGQMVFKDMVRLDTSKVISMEVNEEEDRYILRFHYAEDAQYSIQDHYKIFYIDKKTLLPLEAIDHLVYLGKKQSHHYRVSDLALHASPASFNIGNKDFLSGYAQEVRKPNARLQALVGQPMPPFDLVGFDGKPFRSADVKQKAVLLDFWAVWCGPCIASMPKVQALYDKYRNKGLEVYGVMTEKGDEEPAKLWAKKQSYSFPMLLGNEQLKEAYRVNAIPLYVLVDKEGKIAFVSEGFSSELEAAIQKVL